MSNLMAMYNLGAQTWIIDETRIFCVTSDSSGWINTSWIVVLTARAHHWNILIRVLLSSLNIFRIIDLLIRPNFSSMWLSWIVEWLI